MRKTDLSSHSELVEHMRALLDHGGSFNSGTAEDARRLLESVSGEWQTAEQLSRLSGVRLSNARRILSAVAEAGGVGFRFTRYRNRHGELVHMPRSEYRKK